MRFAEAQGLRDLKLDPNDYVALDVMLNLDTSIPGMVVPGKLPNGEPTQIVLVRFALALPLDNLRASAVLKTDGSMPDPLEGMVPAIKGRFFLPKKRIAERVLKALQAEGKLDGDFPFVVRPAIEDPSG